MNHPFTGLGWSSAEQRSRLGQTVLRLTVALIIGVHGWYRLLHWDAAGLGSWLVSIGVPLGMPIAYFITFLEAFGTLLLVMDWYVLPLCLLFIPIYVVGIVLAHLPDGWFVVGAGRGGSEFSVLLIGALACLALQARPPHGPAAWVSRRS
jgi:putative oxidoreductase